MYSRIAIINKQRIPIIPLCRFKKTTVAISQVNLWERIRRIILIIVCHWISMKQSIEDGIICLQLWTAIRILNQIIQYLYRIVVPLLDLTLINLVNQTFWKEQHLHICCQFKIIPIKENIRRILILKSNQNSRAQRLGIILLLLLLLGYLTRRLFRWVPFQIKVKN